MKQQEVFKKIGGIIKELNEQYEYLHATAGHLNELELELFLANSHFLTDHLLILTKLNAQSAAALMTEAPKEEKYFEPLVQPVTPVKETTIEPPAEEVKAAMAREDNPVPAIDLQTNIGDNFSYLRDEEPEIIRHELIMDEADWGDDDELDDEMQIEPAADEDEDMDDVPAVPLKPVSAINTEIKQAETPAEPVKAAGPVIQPVEAEKADVLTINEKISAQLAGKTSGAADGLPAQKIADLKSAINLNDKLLYIKDLFNGYSLAYSEAIDILNRLASFEEADLFLRKNYVLKNDWESKPETSAKFYALLKRRYA